MLLKINKILLIFGLLLLPIALGDDLLFVQVIWRHGDRTPTETFLNDPNQEEAWPQGWGQLTEWGMRQHVNLGQTLRKKYVDDLKFLSEQYRSDEIYVRSTDVNRTMISAISNLLAMYPGYASEAGHSYPNIPEWPTYKINNETVGFVPIPIHTINDFYDYTLNPDMYCPRQDQLWSLVEETPEYKKLTEDKKDLLEKVYRATGMQTNLTNLWIVADALFIEQSWNKSWVKGINDVMFKDINETNDLVEYWNNGLKLEPYQGIDFSIELPKIRGGSLLWSIIGHMEQKLDCVDNFTMDYCSFYRNLKYYAYSAHDTTLAALFSVLGFNYTNWNEDGYPHYSSAVAIELWKNEDDKTNSIKIIYYPLSNDNINHDEDKIFIPACHGDCTMLSIKEQFKKFRPVPDAATLCATPIEIKHNPGNQVSVSFWHFAMAFGFGIFMQIFLF